MRVISHIATVIIATALLLLVWFVAPGILNAVVDFNITVIKWITGFIPHGAHIESALRLGLGADRALVFVESTMSVRAIFFFLKRFRKGGRK